MAPSHMEAAELATVAQIMEKYDHRTNAALFKLVGSLDSEAGTQLIEELEDVIGKATSNAQCQAVPVTVTTWRRRISRRPQR